MRRGREPVDDDEDVDAEESDVLDLDRGLLGAW